MQGDVTLLTTEIIIQMNPYSTVSFFLLLWCGMAMIRSGDLNIWQSKLFAKLFSSRRPMMAQSTVLQLRCDTGMKPILKVFLLVKWLKTWKKAFGVFKKSFGPKSFRLEIPGNIYVWVSGSKTSLGCFLLRVSMFSECFEVFLRLLTCTIPFLFSLYILLSRYLLLRKGYSPFSRVWIQWPLFSREDLSLTLLYHS